MTIPGPIRQLWPWQDQARLWREQCEKEQAKYQWPASVPVTLLSHVHLKPSKVEWAKQEIARSGFAFLVEIAKGIEIVYDPIPSIENEGGTVDTNRMVILVRDLPYMPDWELPGAILHESWHLWQFKFGLYNPGAPGFEAQAFAIQQAFYLRNGYEISKDKIDNLGGRIITVKWSVGISSERGF